MMFRSSAVVLALWAGAAQAERELDKEEIIAIVRDYAVCYETSTGECYSAEFFTNVTEETLDVTYTYIVPEGISVVRERVTWSGNQICVEPDGSGLMDARTISNPDLTFRFDLSNAPKISVVDMALLRASYASRDSGYCYYWVSDDARYTNLRSVYGGDGSGGSVPMRFVPLTDGSVELLP